MTLLSAVCRKCGHQISTNRLFDIGPRARVTLSDVGISCPCCGAMASVQNGTYDQFGTVSEWENSRADQIGKLPVTSSRAMAGSASGTGAADGARRSRSEFRRDMAVVLQSGAPGLVVAMVMLWRQFRDGKSAERASAAALEELSATRRTNAEIGQSLRRLEKMRLMDRKRDDLP
jgi:hypothetical protein